MMMLLVDSRSRVCVLVSSTEITETKANVSGNDRICYICEREVGVP